MKLGFIGCGTITAAIITGLTAAGHNETIVVSPRNADIAADLAHRFSHVEIAASNQDVLDRCDVAVLAVRPQVVAGVLAELTFRPDHQVISLVAAVSLDYLRGATAPAMSIVRAVPLPMVARRQGPTALFPAGGVAKTLFDRLGTAIELDDETAFATFTAATAMMASYFRFAGAAAHWMENQGIDVARSNAFIRQMFSGLAGTGLETPERSLNALAGEHETRGGLNEQVRVFLEGQGVFGAVAQGLDAVQTRLTAAQAAPTGNARS